MDPVKLRVKFTVYRNKGFQKSDRIETIDYTPQLTVTEVENPFQY